MTSQIHPTVVVGIDGSEQSLIALDVAADEATRRHQPLRVVSAFQWPPFAPSIQVPDAGVADDSLDAVRRMLTDATEKIRRTHTGLDVTTVVILGGPATTLVDESTRASIIVVGNRGYGGFTSLLAGSVATQLATHAHCPVLVVRPHTAPSTATTLPVVVGVDGTEGNETAVGFAFEEAASRGVSLTAVSVWSQPPRSGPDQFKPVAYDYDEARQAAGRELAESLAGHQEKYPDVTVLRELICGLDPAHELRLASAAASLIVVGSRGRGELSGLLLGSVGQTLVHHARCPVAIIRAGTP